MLVTIENLPLYFRYSTTKDLIRDHCELTNVILGDLVTQGYTRKVTVGVPCKEDVVILERNISKIQIEGRRLRVTELSKNKNSMITQNIDDQTYYAPLKTSQIGNIHVHRKESINMEAQPFLNNISRKRPFDSLSETHLQTENIATAYNSEFKKKCFSQNNEHNILNFCQQNIQKQNGERDIDKSYQSKDSNISSLSQMHVGIDIPFPMVTKESESKSDQNCNKKTTKQLKRQRKRHARALRAMLSCESNTTPVQSSINTHSKCKPRHFNEVKSLAVAITRSTGPLSLEQSNQLSEALVKKLVSLSKKQNVTVKPEFRSVPFFIDGVLKLWCANQETLDWLKTSITELDSDMNLKLMLNPQVFPAFKDYCHLDLPGLWPDLGTIINMLKLQNDWLQLHCWHFNTVNVYSNKKVSTVCVRIPKEQIQDLKNRGCRLNFGLGMVLVKLMNKKSKSAMALKAKHAAHAQQGAMVIKKKVENIKEETSFVAGAVKKEEDLCITPLSNIEKRKTPLSIVVNPFSVIDKVIAAANSSLSNLRTVVKKETSDNLPKTIELCKSHALSSETSNNLKVGEFASSTETRLSINKESNIPYASTNLNESEITVAGPSVRKIPTASNDLNESEKTIAHPNGI